MANFIFFSKLVNTVGGSGYEKAILNSEEVANNLVSCYWQIAMGRKDIHLFLDRKYLKEPAKNILNVKYISYRGKIIIE